VGGERKSAGKRPFCDMSKTRRRLLELIVFVLLASLCQAFLPRSTITSAKSSSSLVVEKQLDHFSQQARRTTTALNAFDIPLIPAILGTVGVVFAVFNIPDNKVDLTDRGLAMAKMKRRQERIARGEAPRNTEGLDPYRFKIFEEDDEEIDIDSIGKKKGGGNDTHNIQHTQPFCYLMGAYNHLLKHTHTHTHTHTRQ